VNTKMYSRINSAKSPASGEGNVNESRFMSEVETVLQGVYA